jgi:hypothetical protein
METLANFAAPDLFYIHHQDREMRTALKNGGLASYPPDIAIEPKDMPFLSAIKISDPNDIRRVISFGNFCAMKMCICKNSVQGQ